jgi:hypothetical protein
MVIAARCLEFGYIRPANSYSLKKSQNIPVPRSVWVHLGYCLGGRPDLKGPQASVRQYFNRLQGLYSRFGRPFNFWSSNLVVEIASFGFKSFSSKTWLCLASRS